VGKICPVKRKVRRDGAEGVFVGWGVGEAGEVGRGAGISVGGGGVGEFSGERGGSVGEMSEARGVNGRGVMSGAVELERVQAVKRGKKRRRTVRCFILRIARKFEV
jgi:hypothetical protein